VSQRSLGVVASPASQDGLSTLADRLRADAATFELWGFSQQARQLGAIAGRIELEASASLQHWITEAEAVKRSGRGVDYFRSRFPALETHGLARRGKGREYREVVAVCANPGYQQLESLRRATAEDRSRRRI
jgi:hypothetical protein